MVRILGMSAVAALISCGDGPSDNNHGFGTEYDFVSSDGVRFRNAPGLLVIDEPTFQSQIVQAHREAEACTGITAPGPLVIVVDMRDDEIEKGLVDVGSGRAINDVNVMLLTPTAVLDPYYYTGNPVTGRTPGTSVVRHEDVHLLLAASGFPADLNRTHQSPLFIKCSGLG